MAESHEQKAVVEWFRLQYPQDARAIRASQSGGFKGKGIQGAIRMKHQIAMGVVPGESDLAILLPRGQYGCLLIEMKITDDRRGARKNQNEYIEYHNSIGNCAIVATGVDTAIAAIKTYMNLKKGESHDRSSR